MDKQALTSSSITCFKRCRAWYWYCYDQLLRPVTPSLPLSYGTATHKTTGIINTSGLVAALNYLNTLYGQWGNPFIVPTLRAFTIAYSEKWADCQLVAATIANETILTADLVNPETGRKSNKFVLSGKLDRLVKLTTDQLAILETKTTSDPLNEKYWQRLLIDTQISMYWVLARANGYDPATCVYDVIHKADKAPYLATPMDKRKYKKDGTLYANQRDKDEEPGEWEDRLLEDIRSRPDYYFGRREIPRLDSDLEAFAYELWQIGQDITAAQKNGRWYRSPMPMNCDYCPYFNLCTGMQLFDAGTIPEGFRIANTQHEELEDDNGHCTTTETVETADPADATSPFQD